MRGFTRNCGNVTPKAALCKSACVAVLVCICLRNVMCLFSCACYFLCRACVSLVVGCHLSASFYLLVVSSFFILNVEVISAIFISFCHVIRLLSCACVCCFVVLVSL